MIGIYLNLSSVIPGESNPGNVYLCIICALLLVDITQELFLESLHGHAFLSYNKQVFHK